MFGGRAAITWQDRLSPFSTTFFPNPILNTALFSTRQILLPVSQDKSGARVFCTANVQRVVCVTLKYVNVVHKKMAEGEGFEPPEPFGSAVFKTAAIVHSATPPVLCAKDGAGDGNRTRTTSLEGWGSTIELHPHLVGGEI